METVYVIMVNDCPHHIVRASSAEEADRLARLVEEKMTRPRWEGDDSSGSVYVQAYPFLVGDAGEMIRGIESG